MIYFAHILVVSLFLATLISAADLYKVLDCASTENVTAQILFLTILRTQYTGPPQKKT